MTPKDRDALIMLLSRGVGQPRVFGEAMLELLENAGLAVVPVEPDAAMHRARNRAQPPHPRVEWEAMLAASPYAKVPE